MNLGGWEKECIPRCNCTLAQLHLHKQHNQATILLICPWLAAEKKYLPFSQLPSVLAPQAAGPIECKSTLGAATADFLRAPLRPCAHSSCFTEHQARIPAQARVASTATEKSFFVESGCAAALTKTSRRVMLNTGSRRDNHFIITSITSFTVLEAAMLNHTGVSAALRANRYANMALAFAISSTS